MNLAARAGRRQMQQETMRREIERMRQEIGELSLTQTWLLPTNRPSMANELYSTISGTSSIDESTLRSETRGEFPWKAFLVTLLNVLAMVLYQWFNT
jgi:hypothetical protein